jgi:hypothetical protein
MFSCRREPTLDDILSDSIIRAIMKADGVDPKELEKSLRQMNRLQEPLRESDGLKIE